MHIEHDNAICYSGYRAGQSPHDGTFPSYEEVRHDLNLLSRHWRYIRLYEGFGMGEPPTPKSLETDPRIKRLDHLIHPFEWSVEHPATGEILRQLVIMTNKVTCR